jgi:hypothetical protein
LTPIAEAIASKCNTALVEPPSAMTMVIAFSKAFLVMMSLGRILALSRRIAALPAATQSSVLSFEIAACAELFGRLMPIASIAEAMVLAVYMPPQDPGPGIAVHSISLSSFLLILFCACAPTASNTETTSVGFFL